MGRDLEPVGIKDLLSFIDQFGSTGLLEGLLEVGPPEDFHSSSLLVDGLDLLYEIYECLTGYLYVGFSPDECELISIYVEYGTNSVKSADCRAENYYPVLIGSVDPRPDAWPLISLCNIFLGKAMLQHDLAGCSHCRLSLILGCTSTASKAKELTNFLYCSAHFKIQMPT